MRYFPNRAVVHLPFLFWPLVESLTMCIGSEVYLPVSSESGEADSV